MREKDKEAVVNDACAYKDGVGRAESVRAQSGRFAETARGSGLCRSNPAQLSIGARRLSLFDKSLETKQQ